MKTVGEIDGEITECFVALLRARKKDKGLYWKKIDKLLDLRLLLMEEQHAIQSGKGREEVFSK